jgi:hypothetical protein
MAIQSTIPQLEWKQHPPILPLGSWVMQQSLDAFFEL